MATVNHNYCFSVPTATRRRLKPRLCAEDTRKTVKRCKGSGGSRNASVLRPTPGVTKCLITIGAPMRAELTPCFHCRFAISAHMSAVDSLWPRSEMTEQDAGILRIFLLVTQLVPHGAAAAGQVHIQHDARVERTDWRQTGGGGGGQYQSSCSAAAAVGACVKERTPNIHGAKCWCSSLQLRG